MESLSTFTSPDTVRPPVRSPSSVFVQSNSAMEPTANVYLDRLITAKDHASIQLQVADVDSEGKAIKGQATTIAICGKIRAQGDSDDSINRIATKEGCTFGSHCV